MFRKKKKPADSPAPKAAQDDNAELKKACQELRDKYLTDLRVTAVDPAVDKKGRHVIAITVDPEAKVKDIPSKYNGFKILLSRKTLAPAEAGQSNADKNAKPVKPDNSDVADNKAGDKAKAGDKNNDSSSATKNKVADTSKQPSAAKGNKQVPAPKAAEKTEKPADNNVESQTTEVKPDAGVPNTQSDQLSATLEKINDQKVRALRAAAAERLEFARQEAQQASTARQVAEQQAAELKERIAGLEKSEQELKASRQQAADAVEEISEVRRNLADKYRQVSAQETELQIKGTRLQEAEEALANRERRAQEVLAAAEQAEQAVQEKTLKLNQRKSDLDSLQQDLDQRQAQLTAKEVDIDELLQLANQQRESSINMLQEITTNKDDADRLARAAEHQVKELEASREQAAERLVQLEKEIAEAQKEVERSERLKLLNEAESEMLAAYEQNLKDQEKEILKTAQEAEQKVFASAEQLDQHQQEIDKLQQQLQHRDNDLDARDKKIQVLESQIADKQVEIDHQGAQQPGSQENISEQAAQMAKELTELVSKQQIDDPQMRIKAHLAIKELLEIYEGTSPEQSIFSGAQEVISALREQ